MKRLELGRTPVREALRALARERLVEVYPRRGMFVSSVDVRDLAGLSEVRTTLEPSAARLAAERATDSDRATHRRPLTPSSSTCTTSPDERALIDLDQRIHRHIYECTHNAFLAETLNEYYVLTLRIWFLALDRVARLEDAIREHRELLVAIRAGDGAERNRRCTGTSQGSRARSDGSSESHISSDISAAMSTLPSQARAVVIGCGIVGNSVAYHLTDQGWSDVVLLDKGPLPNPGGSTGHASNFIFPVDHSKEMTQLTAESVRQYKEMGVFTESGGIEVARTEERMQELRASRLLGEGVGDRARIAPDSRRGEGARPVHRRERDPRRFLLSDRRGRRLPAGRDDHARPGPVLRPALGLCEHGGARLRRRGRTSPRRAHDRRRHRGRDRRHRLRCLEPEARPYGRSLDPADAGGAPDDRRRTDPLVRRYDGGHRLPHRPGHGHEHVRAPGGNRPRDRLVCASRDPLRARRPPIRAGGCAHAHRVPVHAGGLHAPDGAGPRADAVDRGRRVRRDQVRGERDPLADARRDADPRRAPRGEGSLVGGSRLGEGGSRRREVPCGMDGARRVAHRPPFLRRRALLGAPEDVRTREGTHGRGLQQDVRHRSSARAMGLEPRRPALALPRARAGARRRLLRGRGLGAPTVVRVERLTARGVRRPSRASRG